MKNLLKLILVVGLFTSLQVTSVFAEGIYSVANSPERAILFISLPKNPHTFTFTTVYAFSNPSSIWNPGRSLIYGTELIRSQFENPIRINANKPFVFSVIHKETGLTCSISRSFIPEENKIYGLIIRYYEQPAQRQNLLDYAIKEDSGKCYFAVVEFKKNHQLIPVKLQDNYPNLS